MAGENKRQHESKVVGENNRHGGVDCASEDAFGRNSKVAKQDRQFRKHNGRTVYNHGSRHHLAPPGNQGGHWNIPYVLPRSVLSALCDSEVRRIARKSKTLLQDRLTKDQYAICR